MLLLPGAGEKCLQVLGRTMWRWLRPTFASHRYHS